MKGASAARARGPGLPGPHRRQGMLRRRLAVSGGFYGRWPFLGLESRDGRLPPGEIARMIDPCVIRFESEITLLFMLFVLGEPGCLGKSNEAVSGSGKWGRTSGGLN